MRMAVLTATVAAVATAPKLARGQEPPEHSAAPADEAVDSISLEDLLSLKVATGSLLDIDEAASPTTVTIITRQQIVNSGARDLSELLEVYVPGFQVMINRFNTPIWGMRGVATDQNTKILLLINGVLQNSQIQDGAVSEVTLGMLHDLERVEVLRGPGGLLYGFGGVAGVVNLITRAPLAPGGEAYAGYGSDNTFQVEALASNTVHETHFTVSAGYRRSDGADSINSRIFGKQDWPAPIDINGNQVPYPSGIYSNGRPGAVPGNLRASVDLQQGNFRLYVRATRQDWDNQAYWPADPFPGLYSETLPSPTDGPNGDGFGSIHGRPIAWSDPLASARADGWLRNTWRTDAINGLASYNRPLPGGDRLDFLASLTILDRSQLLNYTQSEALLAGTAPGQVVSAVGEKQAVLTARYLLNRFELVQSALGVDARLEWVGNDLSGLNLENIEQQNQQMITPSFYLVLSVYDETVVHLPKKVDLFAGLRLDAHSLSGVVLNPKLALVWQAAPKHVIKLIGQSASGPVEAYDYQNSKAVAPSYLDPTDPTSPVLGAYNTPLTSERAYSLELASSDALGGGFYLLPSVSLTRITNLEVYSQDVNRDINAGAYTTLSIELDARYEWSKRLSAQISHVFQRPVGLNPDEVTVVGRQVYAPHPNGDGTFTPQPVPGQQHYTDVYILRDEISYDGNNFLNLATNVTKVAVDYQVLDWLGLHSDLRVFWGLRGRYDLYKMDEAEGYNFLGAETTPIAKWNAGVSFRLPEQVILRGFVYDILGTPFSVNSVRWQQSEYADQVELFNTDQRTFFFSLERSF
jgi:outer membrane receptor protein involved in Fe transport